MTSAAMRNSIEIQPPFRTTQFLSMLRKRIDDKCCKTLDEKKVRKYGARFWHFNWFTPIYIFWFIFGALCLRKTSRAINSNKYVQSCLHQVSQEALESSHGFNNLLRMLEEFDKPPAILMLNQYAINMTHNFLCNTAQMRGVHERLVFVTVDKTAAEVLRKEWPHVKQFYWPTPCLYKRFNFAEPAYQLIYVLRANLAAILIRHGYSFWMMQQDTFWRANLFDLNLEYNSDYDMLFDQIGDSADSPRAELVNGANFFVRANNKSLEFFNAIANKLSHWYAPDMAIMIHQCYTWGHNRSKCEFMSQRIAQSWEWIYTEQKNPPYIMQLDCEVRTGSKLSHLARYGFSFTLSDGKTCNQSGVEMARHRMNTGAVDASKSQLSWGRIQFKAYYFIADWLFRCIPYVKPYLPLMGFCIMVTF